RRQRLRPTCGSTTDRWAAERFTAPERRYDEQDALLQRFGYIEPQVPMDNGDHTIADRLPPLQAALAGTEGVTDRACDHRVHRFALPKLPKQAIPAGVSDEISARARRSGCTR
ncbi:MAG: hypothetical protein ACUVSZ_09630, partial [Chloroflexus sp.]|uniref:hypothetical protein n=1 Tax=Chloroflexus sp. TaxID=1904827 RepID=UPI00404B9A61